MSSTLARAMERIEESCKGRQQETRRFPADAKPGENARQGDVYITKLAGVPSGAKEATELLTQLAEGTTRGSRHELDSLEGVRQWTWVTGSDDDIITGRVLMLDRDRTVMHPDHGHIVFPPGCYLVTYQKAPLGQDAFHRTQD